jgi:hypothetical protein
MASRECSGGSPGGWRTEDGRLWFPTVRGVVAVDPARLPRNPAAPPVVLERMTADNEEVDLSSPARLAPRRQRLEFQYAALSFVAPERIRYRYLLEGFDRDWVDAGAGHQAVYTRLPPGSYRFRVVAANADGAWNESGAVYAFVLAPSFYETAWFWWLAALGLAVVAVGLHLWRVRRLQGHEETLQRRIQEALAEIKVLSGLLPICASCKNVRDDRGYWNRIEVYIREHSEAEFTHGLCPGCLRKLYPEFADRVLAGAVEPTAYGRLGRAVLRGAARLGALEPFAGSVAASATPRPTHRSRSASSSIAPAETNTNPFIGRPVKSIARAPGSRTAWS